MKVFNAVVGSLLVVIMGLFIGCDSPDLPSRKLNSSYSWKDNTIHAGSNVYRYENSEVICYKAFVYGGLSCKFKNKDK